MDGNPRQHLHERIAAELRREILASGKPGDRLPADTEQVQRFGVSIVTVRDALRLLCQEGLLERRHGSGTYVRRRDVNGTVLLIAPAYALDGQAHYFFNRTLLALHEQVRSQGFHVQFSIQDAPLPAPLHSETTSPDLPMVGPDNRVDGVISFLGVGDLPWMEALERQGIPVVSHADWYQPGHVHLDMGGMLTAATEYLVAQGRRRLALVVPEVAGSRPADWYFAKNFLTVLRRHRIACPPKWIVPCSQQGPTPGDDYARIRSLWRQSGVRPDGLLVAMDTLFPAAAMAVVSLGIRCPEDLLIVTHANRGARVFCPVHVVAYEADPTEYAAAMVTLLLQRMRREVATGQARALQFRPQGMDEMKALLAGSQRSRKAS